jgi:hypothetical protein
MGRARTVGVTIPLERKPSEPARTGILDDLRAVYTAIDDEQAQTHVFDVEGSNAAVRYRRMRIEDRIRAQGPEDADTVWERNAQFLIEACDEILARHPETGELEPLIPGERVTFGWSETSKPLHEALSIPETNVRRSVLRLFQGVDAALLRHAEEVDGWMGSVEDRTRERFAGG